PERVRDQRAIATFWTMSPMWAGSRTLTRSHEARPRSVFLNWKKATKTAAMAGKRMNQAPVIALEMLTVNGVIAGSFGLTSRSLEAMSLNTPTNTGTMKATTAISTMAEKQKTKAG